MIYAITNHEGETVGLTNDKDETLRRFPQFTIRWSSASERETFKSLEERHVRKRWLVPRLNAVLWSVWRVSFWPYYRNA